MKELRERVSYLEGLSEGLEIPINTREGRILHGIIEVMGDMVNSLDDLWEAHQELETYLEAIDEDLYDLEGGLSPGLGKEFFDDQDLIELECPKCHDLISFDSDIVEDEEVIEVTCPTCDEVVYINDGSYDLQPAVIDDNNEDENDLEQRPVIVDI